MCEFKYLLRRYSSNFRHNPHSTVAGIRSDAGSPVIKLSFSDELFVSLECLRRTWELSHFPNSCQVNGAPCTVLAIEFKKEN